MMHDGRSYELVRWTEAAPESLVLYWTIIVAA